jgi:ATP-dependent DNA helicase RecQ
MVNSRPFAIREISRKIFHHKALRPGQEEAISAVLDGRDTLAVMPTGSGKSAIYQIPAVLKDGPTGGAVVINSLISAHAQEMAFADAALGTTEFLFVGAEQFSNADRLQAIQKARPSLFVVDEAHCISECPASQITEHSGPLFCRNVWPESCLPPFSGPQLWREEAGSLRSISGRRDE